MTSSFWPRKFIILGRISRTHPLEFRIFPPLGLSQWLINIDLDSSTKSPHWTPSQRSELVLLESNTTRPKKPLVSGDESEILFIRCLLSGVSVDEGTVGRATTRKKRPNTHQGCSDGRRKGWVKGRQKKSLVRW